MLVYSPPIAVSGSGTTPVLGPWVVVELTTIPAWLGPGGPAPVYFGSLGNLSYLIGSAYGPNTVLHWATQIIGPLPADASSVYWKLFPLVSGTLKFGREVPGL